MKSKRILVTGGAGSIGSELVRQLAPKNKVFILDTNETGAFDLTEELKRKKYWVHCRMGDIRDRRVVHDVVSDFKPQIVFHAAAYKHVTPMEWYPEEAVTVNVLGTLNVIREVKNWECLEKFVFISTDKAVNGSSTMGATKRLGEIITKNQGKGFVVVRFGNVLGSRGSVVPIWQGQMDRGERLTVTDTRAERYMMTVAEAVELVVEAAERGRGGEIFVLDMGKRINVAELATSILRAAGKEQRVEIIGLRPGEQLFEEMMTLEESARARKEGKFWIICK